MNTLNHQGSRRWGRRPAGTGRWCHRRRSREWCREFGLSLTAQADVVVSSTAAAANFKVTLTWKKPAADGSVPEPSGGES
ncbi:CU044_2847 family protein [Streptomyces mirabilis]|uniref:CU044_2847 family protein n=1 Tax=Streptomyces mirabilis TaxID=68239 RepID=UPI00363C0F16